MGLDEELGNLAKRFFDEKRIDVYPRNGKYGGAFCIGVKTNLPGFILLNYKNNINSVTTLAHELGHGVNDELISSNQPEIYYGASKATAEVASTFFEDFVLEKIANEFSNKEKLLFIMEKLNDDISTIFRQIALYRFEQELHSVFKKKSYLSTKEIGNLFSKYMYEYMGDYVRKDKGSQNWWIYWGHIRLFFYVYSYSGGLIISKSLQRSVREDKNNIIMVKQFLKSGNSRSPKDVFANLGIDITKKDFWENGLLEVEELLTKAENLAKSL
jgi:oligoendopeptidase F